MRKIKIVLLSVMIGLFLCACGEQQEISELQQIRIDNVKTLAVSYVIDDIEYLAQGQPLLGRSYSEYTYDELEFIMTNYAGFSVDGYALTNAISSFEKGLAETGAIISKGDPVVTLDDNEIIVNVEVVTESKRNVDIEMIFTNDAYDPKLISAAFNVKYLMSEKMSKAALNTVIGMGTVFFMLIVISFIISLFGVFSKKDKKPDKTTEGINRAVEQITKNETSELAADSELVAVIAAAIAAYEGSANTNGFTVRSIRKIKRQ